MNTVKAWWNRHIVATDPNPTYSHLDTWDGLK